MLALRNRCNGFDCPRIESEGQWKNGVGKKRGISKIEGSGRERGSDISKKTMERSINKILNNEIALTLGVSSLQESTIRKVHVEAKISAETDDFSKSALRIGGQRAFTKKRSFVKRGERVARNPESPGIGANR